VALCAGCGSETPQIAAARAFVHALQRSDAETMQSLMASAGVETLKQNAVRAADQVGGRRAIEAHEMLEVVPKNMLFQVAKSELIEHDENTARVRLTGADETTHVLDLVKEEGAWKVRVPPAPRSASTAL